MVIGMAILPLKTVPFCAVWIPWSNALRRERHKIKGRRQFFLTV
jgi:hypothetical protein